MTSTFPHLCVVPLRFCLGVVVVVVLCGSAESYSSELFPEGNRTVFGTAYTSTGGLQMVALGRDGQVWHIYQTPENKSKWSKWRPITSLCPSKINLSRKCRFDGDPALGVNEDGRLEIFVRFRENLDLWQLYQPNAADPSKWTVPRESSCVDQDQESGKWFCLSHDSYWVGENPAFPTSNIAVLRHPTTSKLQVFFRNFEGHMYMVEQKNKGDSRYYTPPVLVTYTLMI